MPKKFLFQPISPFIITQKFGENRTCMDIATGTQFITCDGNKPPAGYKSVYTAKGHTGVDLASKRWNPVYACFDGRVVEKQTDPKSGLGVGIRHLFEGQYYVTKYWHLAAIDVDLDEEVKTGDFIGYADNTGWSSGDHLHWELGTVNHLGGDFKQVDPLLYTFPTFALTAKQKISWIREQIALISDKIADMMRKRL